MTCLGHSWIEVSRRALIHNIRAHRRLIGRGVKLMAIVKANAYGHGYELATKVAEASAMVDWLGVASLMEAKIIRRIGVKLPILVLSFFRPFIKADLIWAIKNNIAFVIYEPEQLRALSEAAKSSNKQASVHLKLETGMARLGLFPEQAEHFMNLINKTPNVELQGIASHFATAESADQTFLKKQMTVYNKFFKHVESRLTSKIIRHIAASAAITTAVASHFDLVRLGIAMYGLWPSLENKQVVKKMQPQFRLQPVLTWKTKVIEVQYLPKNIPVGYDRTYITKKTTVMAVLPVGYWDGLDRGLSNNGYVIIKGVRCPIIGRICMNITMVDASLVPKVKPGDEVVLIGKQKGVEASVDNMAAQVNTINYEITTRLNPLLPRILL